MNLALVSAISYFSKLSVEPLLFELNTFANFIPSVEVDITKLFCRSFPLYHAMLMSQTLLLVPKSTCTHEPTPLFDHRVSKLSSRTLEPGKPV
jgi:hypothetical protein